MFVHCLLAAVLLFSAIPASARQHRATVGRSRVTIVERLRSELLDVIGSEPHADDDELVDANRSTAHLTHPQPTLRRGSSYWWLWLLTGTDLRPDRTPNVPTLNALRIRP